jgi:4,5-dihydroxyphthalate decarboxylase
VATRRQGFERHRFVASALFNALHDSMMVAWARTRTTRALQYTLPEAAGGAGRDRGDIRGGLLGRGGSRRTARSGGAGAIFLYEVGAVKGGEELTLEELFAPAWKIQFKMV